MVEITISENKSNDPVKFFRNRVRIFVNRDYEKGVWIDEDILFELLPRAQKKRYLTDRTPAGRHIKVGPKVASQVIKRGYSPKGRPKIGKGTKVDQEQGTEM
jgi:hypothetical protein